MQQNYLFPMKKVFISFLVFLLIFLAWLAVFFHFGFFNAPLQGDEGDYLTRGLMIKESGFSVALGDGYRPPLFPAIIALLSYIASDDHLLAAVRIINILVVSLIPSMWLFLFLGRRQEGTVYLLMAVFTAVWFPYYYFSFFVLAEAPSFLLLNILVMLLLITGRHMANSMAYPNIILMAIAIACLFLLKANNILIAIPIGLFFLLFSQGTFWTRSKGFVLLTGLSALLIMPWLLFMHSNTSEWKLSTTGGINLLAGTGRHNLGMEPDYRALPEIFMHKTYGDYPQLDPRDQLLLNRAFSRSISEADDVAKRLALNIWSSNAKDQITYGVMKVLHSCGFSFRHALDYYTVSFFLLVLAASLVMWISYLQSRPLLLLHWGIAFCGFIVTFFWLPNIRFKTFYFDATGLLVLSVFVHMWVSRISQRHAPN